MVRLIIWIIVGLLILSFFGISLRHLVESPTNQDNMSFLWNLIQNGWHIFSAWLHETITWFKSLFHLPKVPSLNQ